LDCGYFSNAWNFVVKEPLDEHGRRNGGSVGGWVAAMAASILCAGFSQMYGQQPNSAAAHASAGWKAYEEGRFTDASSLLEEAVKQSPRNADYVAALAEVDSKLGQPDAAIKLLRRAVLLKPEDSEFRLDLAQLLQKKENDQEALEILQGHPNPQLADPWHFSRGFSLFRLGRLASASGEFKLVLQKPQFTAPTSFFLGNIAYMQGQFTQAEPYLATAVELGNVGGNKAYNVYTYDYGLVLYKLEKFAEAAQQFKASIAQYDADPLPWMFLGRCEEELGNYSEAIAMLETSIQKDSTFQLADYELARLQQRHGDPKRAEELFKKISDMKQEDVNREQERAMRLKVAPRPQ
jgi:tetratricopeptide (TPR) repeat protein